ncbi:hypothetical protein [Solilutibacter pythonis]|nr:hypothetical protein [Lysobacter pythonis]
MSSRKIGHERLEIDIDVLEVQLAHVEEECPASLRPCDKKRIELMWL